MTIYTLLFNTLRQVIIEGLKESGVFRSVIAKAPSTLSRDKFLASIESSNSSRTQPPRKIDIKNKENHSQATVRKALEVSEFQQAVPPLSPPGPTMKTTS